jgi:diacylglycerol O-acyltransferase
MARQLSGLDATMLYAENARTPNHIGPLEVYDAQGAAEGSLTFDRFREHVQSRIQTLPELRERLHRLPLDLDRPYWVEDPDFDLEFHLRHTALPAPGDWQQLRTQVARIHSRPLDLSRPPWEMWFIEGLDAVEGVPPGAVAVYVKYHHAAIDGVAGVRLLTALHDPEPGAVEQEPAGTGATAAQGPPSTVRMLGTAAVHLSRSPDAVVRFSVPLLARHAPAAAARLPAAVRSAPRLATSLPSLLRAVRRPRLPGPPPTRFGGRVSSHRTFDALRFPLDDLKAMRGVAPGATLNDVVIALVSGGMRAYLLSKDELPEASLSAIMPMSVRRDGAEGGNHVAMVPVSLATDLADPGARLAAVRDATRAAKGMADAIGARALMDVSQALPGALLAIGLRATTRFSVMGGMANTTVTNVPGPARQMYLAGAANILQTGLVPVMDGMGLFHAMTSYCGESTLSYTACRDMLPDPDAYTRCLRDAYEELRALTPARAGSAAATGTS